MHQLIKSPWEHVFTDLLKNAKSSIYLASPFVKRPIAALIAENARQGIDLRYINSFKLNYFYVGASDLEALRILDRRNCQQKSVQNLHAKLFIFDNEAVITSGNLTPGGLRNNLEYGILVRDELVDKIRQDYLEIFTDPDYDPITLDRIERAEAILGIAPKAPRPKLPREVHPEDIESDEVVDDRFKGGVPAILASLFGWEKDVFECLLEIETDVFAMNDAYQFEARLSRMHPDNRFVQEKIRQQLQDLVRDGLLERIRHGLYKKLWQ